jgi:hypothetical protein
VFQHGKARSEEKDMPEELQARRESLFLVRCRVLAAVVGEKYHGD